MNCLIIIAVVAAAFLASTDAACQAPAHLGCAQKFNAELGPAFSTLSSSEFIYLIGKAIRDEGLQGQIRICKALANYKTCLGPQQYAQCIVPQQYVSYNFSWPDAFGFVSFGNAMANLCTTGQAVYLNPTNQNCISSVYKEDFGTKQVVCRWNYYNAVSKTYFSNQFSGCSEIQNLIDCQVKSFNIASCNANVGKAYCNALKESYQALAQKRCAFKAC